MTLIHLLAICVCLSCILTKWIFSYKLTHETDVGKRAGKFEICAQCIDCFETAGGDG